MNKGKIYLLPSVISPDSEGNHIAVVVPNTIKTLNYFVVENIRAARRFISKLNNNFFKSNPVVIEKIRFEIINKNTSGPEIEALLDPILRGQDCGILSEAGCPVIADPGSDLVRLAHAGGIGVVPFPGPNSIVMALMGSGLNGQSFVFHGYLPIKKVDLQLRIKEIERESARNGQTQIFIETPYRNQKIYDVILDTCKSQTLFCIAMGISSDHEFISTKTIQSWRRARLKFQKVPAVFLLSAG